jgi:hypothetical protein
MVLWKQYDIAVLTTAMSLSQTSTKVQGEGDEIEACQPLSQGLATHFVHFARLLTHTAML